MRILALSSSRVGGGSFLEQAAPLVHAFLGTAGLRIAFLPFAAVDKDYQQYASRAREGLSLLPYAIETASEKNAKEILEAADVIMTGGGNTFKLLHDLYQFDNLEMIRQKVQQAVQYIGWRAG